MVLCLVQPNASTKYIRLWKFDPSRKEKERWISKLSAIPYEIGDTRFRDAVRLCCSDSWMLFYDEQPPTKGGKPITIPETLKISVENDPPVVPLEDDLELDFSSFWRQYNANLRIEKQQEKLKTLKKDPTKVVIPIVTEKLIQRYKAGETLPSYAMKLIEKLINQ
jgi:hypothetical protein